MHICRCAIAHACIYVCMYHEYYYACITYCIRIIYMGVNVCMHVFMQVRIRVYAPES